MGKVKIAETLCRAVLHLGTTTVGRILKEAPHPDPVDPTPCTAVMTAKRRNDVWHIDLTTVPTAVGFWAPWLPFTLPQYWPFCWWVAVVINHYSRHIMGLAVFKQSPTSRSVQHFLERAMSSASANPGYIICNKGKQFWCVAFKDWCDRQGITPRFGAVGQHGSIVPIKRFILTLKNECTRIILIPLRTDTFALELSCFTAITCRTISIYIQSHCEKRDDLPGHPVPHPAHSRSHAVSHACHVPIHNIHLSCHYRYRKQCCVDHSEFSLNSLKHRYRTTN